MIVGDLMNKNLATADKNIHLTEAIKLMERKKVEAILVTENSRLAGIATYRDIMAKIGSRRSNKEIPSSIHLSGCMTPHLKDAPLKTVKMESDAIEAIELILQNNISNLPVVKGFDEIMGLIGKNELIDLCLNIHNIKAYEIMTENPLSVSSTDSIDEARRILLEKKITSLPVTENNRLVGLISVSNIAYGLAAFKEIAPSKTLSRRIKFLIVNDLMEREPPKVKPYMKVSYIVKVMKSSPSRSIPVIDEENKLLGIISRTDILNIPGEKIMK